MVLISITTTKFNNPLGSGCDPDGGAVIKF